MDLTDLMLGLGYEGLDVGDVAGDGVEDGVLGGEFCEVLDEG